ncbi:uncharacterized protein LOC134206983 [Armigeres subalbatus]|uniref:uncharacterized protein LOC134206983 n=1 Tax=Armigeres subalbatus TaxID=124917 RepID=UPI002ED3A73B
MSKRRNCVFNEELQKEFKFVKLDTKFSDCTRVICTQFGGNFSVAHGGKSDISQHLRSQRHKSVERAVVSARPINSFMVKQGSADFFKIAASEALFAYHCVRHSQSFRSNDCLSKLINKLYDPKFSSARTKSEAIVTNVLSPFALQEVVEDLRKVNSVTISVDASNKKDIKLFPVVVRYFLPNRGVHDRILDFVSLPGETSDLQCSMLTDICDRYDLRSKIVALCADNTNTNFGGCKRQGKNNVWRKLEMYFRERLLELDVAPTFFTIAYKRLLIVCQSILRVLL